jgi:thiamine biosynthesis lipoprotein
VSDLFRFRSMGCEVLVAGADARQRRAIRKLFQERDARFSRFTPTSELSQVNRKAGRSVLVSPAFAEALYAALDASRSTDGVLDPTLGWALLSAGYDRDFGDLRATDLPPGPAHPGRAGEVRTYGRLVTAPPGVLLDLNGVVKSMAVDDAVELLPGGGWVSAGGDLAIASPTDIALPGGGAVRLERGALATSGTSRRRWVRDGIVQHHLIDARTGRPSASPWEQVTACGATCLAADTAARAAFLLGRDGPDWLDEHGVPGRFIDRDGVVVMTRLWAEMTEGWPACT